MEDCAAGGYQSAIVCVTSKYKGARGAGNVFLRRRQACQKLRKTSPAAAGLLRRLNCSLSGSSVRGKGILFIRSQGRTGSAFSVGATA